MTSPFKGGRNNPAPYETTLIRVPLEIKAYLERLSTTYKFAVKMGDKDVIVKFVTALYKFAHKYNPINEKPLETELENCEVIRKQLNNEIVMLQNINRNLQDRINIIEYNNREAKAILQESLKLKQIRATAVKKQVEKALKLID